MSWSSFRVRLPNLSLRNILDRLFWRAEVIKRAEKRNSVWFTLNSLWEINIFSQLRKKTTPPEDNRKTTEDNRKTIVDNTEKSCFQADQFEMDFKKCLYPWRNPFRSLPIQVSTCLSSVSPKNGFFGNLIFVQNARFARLLELVRKSSRWSLRGSTVFSEV